MSVAIEFPGTAVLVQNSANNAILTVTLPAPGAGFLQYIDGFVVSAQPAGAIGTANFTISNLAGGTFLIIVTNSVAGGLMLTYTFPPGGYPASGTATAISATVGALGGFADITLYGHNVPA